MDFSQYEFVNLKVEDVRSDLQSFIGQLHAVNPCAKMILTVSPVSLTATYENRHVLCSTTYSKSVLRVAADEVTRSNDNVDYFPSFEIITGSYSRGEFFHEDVRSVRPEGVAQVMGLFMTHYGGDRGSASIRLEDLQARRVSLVAEASDVAAIICEEEALDW